MKYRLFWIVLVEKNFPQIEVCAGIARIDLKGFGKKNDGGLGFTLIRHYNTQIVICLFVSGPYVDSLQVMLKSPG